MTSSAFDNQATDVEMQCEDQEYQEPSADANATSGESSQAKKVNLFKPHSRRIFTRNIVEMFVKKKAALKNLLITSKQRVSLTTDIWVSQVTEFEAHNLDD
ncbi:unnamed protein product [Brassica oleracea var. botrytis]|uniref:Uncharacterized protein n=1 Tax=Brassica oleracea TaxID=3712 RepID=A0A3P6AL23_BRAOL|nr:unnamed protein product [Brassica oleracea]